ncbi:MAG: hypothetical protein EHM83_00190 [Burkholderiales bacterium]|nr:MAG: hypothetical protein EHM83_00190 [Burkholderiales bacterium]
MVPVADRHGRPKAGRAVIAATIAAAIALLAACGQRGPLYLPDSQPKKKLAHPAPRGATQPGAAHAPPAPRG